MPVIPVTIPEVIVYPGGGTSPASVTGGPPQWSDGSDATYATNSAVGFQGTQYIGGDLVAEGTLDGTALTLTLRLQFTATMGGGTRRVEVHWFDGEEDAGATAFVGTLLLGDVEDTTVEVHPLDFNTGHSLAGFCDAINAGTASARVLCGGPGSAGITNTLTVFELGLEGPGAEPEITGVPDNVRRVFA